eukprot:Seg108.1 transcript_id=Seg108.1/GoldUCD/mRNA.D3Y31 product="hypothetical protein" protein_id=Seg108.1/GoldUCD/D3Y31
MMEDIECGRKKAVDPEQNQDDIFPEDQSMSLFWNAQKEMIEKGTRNWHPRIIEVCLRLWNRSKQGYEELRQAGFFKLPSGRTLQVKKNIVKQTPGIQDNILEQMRQNAIAKRVPETGYHGFIVFDEMSIQGNLEMKKVGDEFEVTGLVDMGQFNDDVTIIEEGKRSMEMATHILQFVFHSCEGKFQFPYAYYPTAKLSGSTLFDMYWDGVAGLLHYGFDAHMGLCDGGQCNRTFITLHFDSEEDAIAKDFTTTNPINDQKHVFMMDPSHNFKKIRNNVEKSSASGKTTRHLMIGDKEILWSHWRASYAFDCRSGIRTFQKLTDEHFELTPCSRMRNHLADDVLSPRMSELMLCYKSSLLARHVDGSFLDTTIEFLENCSILLKNFKSKAPYKSPDDSRFIENESVLHWLDDWEKTTKQLGISALEKRKRMISSKTKFDLNSMVKGFKAYCLIMMECFEGIHIVTHTTSQDYVELFFACQRAQQGQTTNPTEQQYATNINAITKMRDLKFKKSNCGMSHAFTSE